VSNFTNRLLSIAEQALVGLGVVVPPTPSPFNPNERTVQLLDLLRLSSSNLITATYSKHNPSVAPAFGEYFFISDRPLTIIGTRFLHTVAETTSPVMPIYVEVLRGALDRLPGSGFSLNGAQFDGKATAGVLQLNTMTQATLLAGDRLALRPTGTPTELRGVHVTVYMVPAAP